MSETFFERLYSEDNPDNIIEYRNQCYLLLRYISVIIPMIIVVAILYIIAVYLTFGVVILINPESDSTTGCRNDRPQCKAYEKMFCYKNDMTNCYFTGIVTAIGMFFVVLLIMGIINCIHEIFILIMRCINTARMDRESFTIEMNDSFNV